MITVGIDVGGKRKGFHGVALDGNRMIGKIHSCEVDELIHWCTQDVNADLVSVDAPCRWAKDGKSRPAEQQLMARRIQCYSTPLRPIAVVHPTNFYGWVLQGEELYAALERHFPLYTGQKLEVSRICFETFPHAITWHLRGGDAVGELKAVQRRELLQEAKIDTASFHNMDFIDAALCALAAKSFSENDFSLYGEVETGYIIVPKMKPRFPV